MKYSVISDIRTATGTMIVPIVQGSKTRLFADVITAEHIKGSVGELLFTAIPNNDTHAHVLFVGLGAGKKMHVRFVCESIAQAVKYAQDKKQANITIAIPSEVLGLGSAREIGETLVRLIGITTYHFTEYLTDTARHATVIEHITFAGVPKNKIALFKQGITHGLIIAEATAFTRTLGNHTPSHMHPVQLAETVAQASAHIPKLSVRHLSKSEIEAEGMGGLLGVSAGSARPPAFIIMEYLGGKKSEAPVVFVGKGITFDAGGISIKPSNHMHEMKFDMMGGATVIGALLAIAKLKLRVNVIGLIPAAENLPSGTAIVPSDILRMHSGKTVEVQDTDAEGRLILADALSYAKKYNPKYIVDLATLTGACVVAIGETRAGVWSTDDRLAARLGAVGEKLGEFVWRMPLGSDFSEQLKSDVADLKNITDRWGSANTAAAFLQEFVSGPWAHLDIAGVAYSNKLTPSRRSGATGWGVSLLIELVRR